MEVVEVDYDETAFSLSLCEGGATVGPAGFEGVLLALGELPRFACEEEMVDRHPGDGDWFWTWAALESEWGLWEHNRA